MAVTISSGATAGRANHVQARRQALVSVTFDDSYPTGGEELVGLNALIGFTPAHVFVQQTAGTVAYSFVYTPSTNKLEAFWGDDGAAHAEVTAATDLSGVTVSLLIFEA